MQGEKIPFVQVLRIHNTELYQVKEGKTSLKSKGDLQVLYAQSYDIFILRIKDLKFTLVNKLEVIGVHNQKEGFSSYMLPCPGGSFVIKILDTQHPFAVQNLNTILANNTHFLNRTGLEERLANTPESEVIEKRSSISEGLHRIMDKVTHVIAPSTNDDHINQRAPRSFSELKTIEGSGQSIVDMSYQELRNLTDEAGEVARNHQEAPHWRDLKEDSASGFHTSFAGTGLTSQSMGSEETHQPQVIIPSETEKIPPTSDFERAITGAPDRDSEISFSDPNNLSKGTRSSLAKNLEMKPSDSISSQKSWGSNITNSAMSNVDSESLGGSDLGSDFSRVNIGREIIIPYPGDQPVNKLGSENVGNS